MPSQPRRLPRLPALEERLQLALDAGAIAGTWFWDVVNDLFTSDRRFARYFSLDEARLQAGVPLREVVQSIHPDDEPGVQRLIEAALAQGGAYRAEYRVWHPGGRYRWVEANGTVTLDEQGRALTFPGVLVDIHRRKATEQMQRELLRLSDRLRELDGTAEILHAVSAACGTALDASRTGYGVVDPVEDVVDITCDWRRPGTDSIVGVYRFRDFGSYIDDLRAGQIVAIADVLTDPRTAPHGEAFAPLGIRALLNVPLRRAGELLGVLIAHDAVAHEWTDEEIGFASNVADRTWAALATAQAASRLRTLNDDVEREVASRASDRTLLWTMTRDLMFVSRLGGALTAANPAWTATLGWSEAELLGHNLLELVHPDDQALTRANAARIRHGHAVTNFENRCRHKDGGYRWIAWNAGPGNGFIVGAGRDVSAAKELALAQEQLRQSQKMEAVGQLTGGVAHDFNNLLTVIGTSVSLLKTDRISPEQRTRSLEAISKTVKRASRLTAQLLAFARRQALSPVVFDASQNVGAVAEMLGTLVGARIEVQTRLSPGCFINADPSQFDTALVNLAVNARDAMEGAGQLRIEVSLADRVPEVRLHPAVQGDFVAVSVADSGTGISKDNLARIFEPFFTTKALGQGTGLGLSQVFGFAKQSGGDVTVQSEPGEGATFTMYFPRASVAADDGADEADAAARLDTPDGGLLLVVEDNLDVAQAVESSLRALGYRTEWVSNAAAALARLATGASQFTAVFSDVVMAGLDGIEMARQVRARWPTLPVVLSSGYSHVLANDSSHGFDLLAKPYELDTLALTLKRAIDRAGAPRVGVAHEGLTTEAVQSMLDDAVGETARQAALDAMQVLDTPPETAFDDLVRMAADICETPIALVSLIDADRQWFKARVGLQARQTPREHAFCAHAIKTPQQLMVVEDAQSDPRFADNPLVTGDPNIRFYAGAPLVDDSGHALGTLCVISPQARGLEPRQAELLAHLATQVVKRLQQRRDRLHGAADER